MKLMRIIAETLKVLGGLTMGVSAAFVFFVVLGAYTAATKNYSEARAERAVIFAETPVKFGGATFLLGVCLYGLGRSIAVGPKGRGKP